jgi:hypothetical protein
MDAQIPLDFKPGIQRDGTALDSDQYIDGLWCRFEKNRPRKIPGYRELTNTLNGPSNALHGFPNNGNTFVHSGSPNAIDSVTVSSSGTTGSVSNRTPAGFVADANNSWQIDALYDAVSATTTVCAHYAPNGLDISSTGERPYFLGDILLGTPLVEVVGSDVAGGIVAIPPFLFRYGHDGFIGWSDINKPDTISGGSSGEARVAATKLVRGLALRGSSNGPAGLFWALDALVRASFIGGTAFWQFDTLSTDTSVLSSNSICEYDGVYYWAALERFQMFNGVVREIPNDDNLEWFFSNLNTAYRQKCFTMKVPRKGEIWFCFPFGNATECTHAAVLNVRGGFWYDTELPPDMRSSALYAQVYPFPLMGSPTQDDTSMGYSLWQHETGLDRVKGSSVLAIPSSFTTPYITIANVGEPPSEKAISLHRIEPDIVQTGDMTVEPQVRANAKCDNIIIPAVTIPETPSESSEQMQNFKTGARQVSLKFQSNVAGGNYWMGRTMAHVAPAEAKLTQ